MKTQLARPGTQVERAIQIYLRHQGKENHRQLCLTELQKTLGHKASTAATYYYIAERKLDQQQRPLTEEVVASSRKIKFSSVKLKRGTDQAARVHCFFTRKAAKAFNAENNFTKVVKGIQQVGKTVGTVVAA